MVHSDAESTRYTVCHTAYGMNKDTAPGHSSTPLLLHKCGFTEMCACVHAGAVLGRSGGEHEGREVLSREGGRVGWWQPRKGQDEGQARDWLGMM